MTQFLVVSNPKTARTTYHITSSGEMKPPFNFPNIVAENGGRGHTEVTVCMYGQHPQESIDGPGMAAIPAHGRITRENVVFPAPFAPEKLVSRDGFGRLVLRQPVRSLHAGRLNLVLSHGNPAAFYEGFHIYTANRYGVSPKFIGPRYCMLMSFTAKSPLVMCL